MNTPIASRWQLPPGEWSTVLEGLCARFPSVSRDTWRDRMRRGRVQDREGVPLAPDAPYRVGLEVRYFREVTSEPDLPFAEQMIHADAHLLVVDKPPFLPVTPGGAWVEQCLLRRLVRATGNETLVPLHRIDRATSGLVMFSVNPGSRAAYQALFRERGIRKHYLALASPLPGVAFPLRRHSRIANGSPFPRMQEEAGAANAETLIDVGLRGREHWQYRLEPVTGRKHQLRVQMAALGVPLLNDPLYGPHAGQAADDWQRPLALLAKSLAFIDPLDGRRREFESPRDLRPD
ncbi:pseudouridine synthase [Arenimonas sp. MALMAid1274]|uniref:pseudouridine synthase n=1 Tax=Arenimonas sp. MALMAid1274 TaxID=3411630 RepID=UPI003BA20B11